MDDNSFTIDGRSYTEKELIEIGKDHYPKFYWISRGVGIGLMSIGVLSALMFLVMLGASGFESYEGSSYYLLMTIFCIIASFGVLLFLISFIRQSKRTYIEYAKAYLARYAARNEKIARKEEKDNVEQLINYKKLLDAGIITQEEFDQKKKELL